MDLLVNPINRSTTPHASKLSVLAPTFMVHINLSSKSQGLGACLVKKAGLPVVFWEQRGRCMKLLYSNKRYCNFLIVIEVVLALILCRLLADRVIYTGG